ncbi:MAG: cupredoxin domain-containing protein [Myxococcales bacterium]|nr:cupredoxin domain-containing protein [Myxococcales bacterium]
MKRWRAAGLGGVRWAGLLASAVLAWACGEPESTRGGVKTATTPRVVHVVVGDSGYNPSQVKVLADEPIELIFRRTSDSACGKELVFPERKIVKQLPLNRDVSVQLMAKAEETIHFTCGMGMLKGSVVAVKALPEGA